MYHRKCRLCKKYFITNINPNKYSTFYCETCGSTKKLILSAEKELHDMKAERIKYESLPRVAIKQRRSWANKFKSCIECKTTKYRHRGNGRCQNCYNKYRRECRKKSSI